MVSDSWQAHLNRAATAGNAGDLLLLADEAPQPALRARAWTEAAKHLHADGHADFARELFERALSIDAGNPEVRQLLNEPAPAAAPGGPRQVLLFSGHMLDAPGRSPPRFPADKVPHAAQRITEVLEQLDAGSRDIALTQGACGGDLLFSAACLQRDVKLHWLQPFVEPEFIERSVRACGADWLARYQASRAALAALPRAAAALGPAPAGKRRDYAYERCNLWLLYTALAHGPDKLHLVCLWNGAGSEGPGGTGHMAAEVKRRHGKVSWIDTRLL